MPSLDITSTLTLNDGVEIPRFGLGVWQAPRGEAEAAVLAALKHGYRHVDTARVYKNEDDVGRALRKSGVPREEVFVTTKLWNSDHGGEKPLAAMDASLEKLGLAYVDLYLIHWPVPKLRGESWRALEKLRAAGRCRSIGVSNFTVAHLEELAREGGVVPSVNQVEFHPFLFQRELLAYCRSKGIAVEAYSPLTSGKRLDHPGLGAVAARIRKTPPQVLLRWALQHDLVVIPKSVHEARIVENANVFDFELSAADMADLNALDENLRTCWDPTTQP